MNRYHTQTTSEVIGTLIGFFLAICIIIAAGYGYVQNILKLIHMDVTGITGELLVRAIGIFIAPLGVIAGYF